MTVDPQTPPSAPDIRLCMDARMLTAAGGTGVSSYAHQLQRAQASISGASLLLTDRPTWDGLAPAPFGRPGRWLRALWPGARPARAIMGERGEPLFYAPDVFRVAQIYFDVHRRLLPIRLPGPPGIMHWT